LAVDKFIATRLPFLARPVHCTAIIQ